MDPFIYSHTRENHLTKYFRSASEKQNSLCTGINHNSAETGLLKSPVKLSKRSSLSKALSFKKFSVLARNVFKSSDRNTEQSKYPESQIIRPKSSHSLKSLRITLKTVINHAMITRSSRERKEIAGTSSNYYQAIAPTQGEDLISFPYQDWSSTSKQSTLQTCEIQYRNPQNHQTPTQPSEPVILSAPCAAPRGIRHSFTTLELDKLLNPSSPPNTSKDGMIAFLQANRALQKRQKEEQLEKEQAMHQFEFTLSSSTPIFSLQSNSTVLTTSSFYTNPISVGQKRSRVDDCSKTSLRDLMTKARASGIYTEAFLEEIEQIEAMLVRAHEAQTQASPSSSEQEIDTTDYESDEYCNRKLNELAEDVENGKSVLVSQHFREFLQTNEPDEQA
jgi:hypothetical protein